MYEFETTRILNFLRDVFSGGEFKSFWEDDPDAIAIADMPALIVEKQSDNVNSGDSPTGTDRVIEEVLIKVVMNKREDHDRKSRRDLTKVRIRRLVEGRDAATGQYSPNSIKGALRNQLTLGGLAVDNDMSFELGILPRPNDVITAEGHLTIRIGYYVAVPSRT